MKVVFNGRLASLLILAATSPALFNVATAAPPEQLVRTFKTPDGVEYGLWGKPTEKPAPTLVVLAGTIEGTLGGRTYRQCGNQLAKQGYLLVSIDIPCHGKQSIPGQPNGLTGWSHRVGKNENIVDENNARLSKVLDHLIRTGVTDPKRIAACGTSRGGFLAIHFAAADKRVKCAAGFAPVTDLAALSEFRTRAGHPLVKKLSLANQAEKLAGRPVWVIIGDRDDRVGTDKAYEFASRVSAAARKKNVPSNVALHILSEPRGHTTPPGGPEMAAKWIDRQLHPQRKSKPAATETKPQTLLLVDDYHVLYRAGTKRVFHPAKLNPTNPVIREDKPWEMAIGWTSIIRHPKTGKYQLWYQAYGGHRDPRKSHKCVVCLAESKDGIHFTKPDYGLHDFDGRRFGLKGKFKKTNIVLLGNNGYGDRYANSVLYEPHEPDPSKRYKMLYTDFSKDKSGREWPGFHAAFSPDGIHWKNAAANPLNRTAYGGRGLQPPLATEDVYVERFDQRKDFLRKTWKIPLSMSDAADVFFDPVRRKYVVYGKAWLNGPAGGLAWKHAMARVESDDFLSWSKPQLVCSPDDHDPPNTEFHTSPVFYHKGCYFCLNQILSSRGEANGTKADAMSIELMISRDGIRWERPFRSTPFIDAGQQAFSNGGIFTNATPIILDNAIRFYYGGYNSGAIGGGKKLTDPSQQSGVGFSSIVLDRFAGIRPVAVSAQSTLRRPLKNIGQVTLKPLDLKGIREITINGNATKGTIAVEILNADGYRMPGFTKAHAKPIKGIDPLETIEFMKRIKKLLVANRGEIAIRVFRSSHELGIRTVAIYSHEDRYALHRYKADEAYCIGQPGEPIQAYLNIDDIIATAKLHQIDAIHPGYGFLSENANLPRACVENDIVFVGPPAEILEKLGDKTEARLIAQQANVPILQGTEEAVSDVADGQRFAAELGFPVILKAAMGGGGRGMRVVRKEEEFADAFEQAQREALSAFGCADVFIEKFIQRARHIEVQLLGDKHGNLVHLFERDCSVQRRHQKVVEIAPAPNLESAVRDRICESAIAIGKTVGYENAGTVEFLVDSETNEFYFIEVNPRIQVEHTVTEEVTGVDVVKSQILVAQGVPLDDSEIDLGAQDRVATTGFAIQCRITTEDPTNNFLPDYGKVTHYRSASGMGVRLDAGSAFSGAVVNPFYDSLLVKLTARGRRFQDAAARMERSLQEFRIRGVETNIPFLLKLITHATFLNGDCTTRFIDNTPELFDFPTRKDRATKLLTYIGDVIVNGNTLVNDRPVAERRIPAPVPKVDLSKPAPDGTRQRLQEMGAEKFSQWILDQKPLLITDTTFRDAHQSLLATRFRTYDLLQIADVYARNCSQLFSLEMWGGATFDVTMRFLKESPWDRLTKLRERIPNILFQMLLRASNAVGYTNYPDNVVTAFVKESADAGIDVFRVFDALNSLDNMRVAVEAVRETGAICEAAICYTGDILDDSRTKYDLKYFVNMAKQLESMGANILAIKDMAGLCKPYAAERLVRTLKSEIGIPVHFHTHDTGATQAASILKGAECDLDIADAAMAALAGGTSQPNLNTLVEALRFTDRDTGLPAESLDQISEYWRNARQFYTPFESAALPATADLYDHQMPGGQYTNLYEQARALGLADQWRDVCRVYANVNRLFGDIVKVTPTSKAVGDMALFLVANGLTVEDVLDSSRELAYPNSVVDLMAGRMGPAMGGFPEDVQKCILRGEKPVDGRPGASMPPADFEATAAAVEELIDTKPTSRDVISSLLYPEVFKQFVKHQQTYSDTSCLPSPVFFYGQLSMEEVAVEIETGKTLIIKFLAVGEPLADGRRHVFFELNGVPRSVTVVDRSLEPDAKRAAVAEPDNPKHLGASMPGMVVTLAVQPGDKVKEGQKLLVIEAMKMQSTIVAERDGKIDDVLVKAGSQIETGQLLLTFE
eukprot:g26729.t1